MTARSAGPRVLIAGGGTAGHVLPGIALADSLVAQGMSPDDVAFAGGDRGVERRLVGDAGYALTELAGRGIQRRFTLTNLRALGALSRGLVRGARLVRTLQPDVVVVLGGYASFGCGLGAVLWRKPLVLMEQNARAGAVNRLLGHWARRSAVTFPGTDLPHSVLTGNPLRAELAEAARRRDDEPGQVRADACAELDLPPERTVILVTTGSLGARKVNDAVVELATRWVDRADLAIRHVTGRRDYADVVRSTAALTGRRPSEGLVYQVVEYEDHMARALSAADVAVTRAGGGVAELTAFGVPAVLVPLPIAPRDHQRANARYLVDVGGAVLLDDAHCDGTRLGESLTVLLDDADVRDMMARAMRSAASPGAADAVADLVREVADGH